MTDQRSQQTPSDEQLVAYLDGQLSSEERLRIDSALPNDEALEQRLEWLSRSDLPFQSAYADLLGQAPQERLTVMLAAVPAPAASAPLSRRRFIAAAAGFLVAGIAADRLFLGWQASTRKVETNWRGLVADYMALYTPQTLDNLPDDEASQRAQLHTIGQRLGLTLEPAQLVLSRPVLKRAQLLEYDGVPIAQITYLDPVHGPLALCITRSKTGTRHPAQEQRRGMNIVYWSGMEHAFMVIGHNPTSELEAMAQLFRSRISV
jgi:anti-sigma factor RsiW